jgi:hypothetical protein
MLDIYPCGDQVWITSQASLLVYDASATMLRNIRKPHSDTPRAVAFVRATEKLSKPHICQLFYPKTSECCLLFADDDDVR